MKGFCLLLFACLLATCGFSQKPDHYGLDAMILDVDKGHHSVEDVVCSEDLLMVGFSEMCVNVGVSMLSSGSLSPFKASIPALSFALTF